MLFEACNLVVDRDTRRSLDDVSLAVGSGEFVGVVGPNGAGKTTLLRALLGLQPIQSGEIRIAGKPIRTWSRRELAQAIGYLPQGATFYWPLTVERAVGLGRFPHQPPYPRMPRKDADAIEAAMITAGIDKLAARRVDRLSGGECMRVHLARLLAGGHRGIVADEPITSLDVKYQLHFMSLLKGQVASGLAVVVSLHDLSLAARFCDRLVVLQGGHLVVSDTPERALSDATLARVFEVKADRFRTDHGTSIIPSELLPAADERPDVE